MGKGAPGVWGCRRRGCSTAGRAPEKLASISGEPLHAGRGRARLQGGDSGLPQAATPCGDPLGTSAVQTASWMMWGEWRQEALPSWEELGTVTRASVLACVCCQ